MPLPAELANLDQLKVLLDALPDYHAEDEQPSFVLAIPCRPVLSGLKQLLPLPASWGGATLLAPPAVAAPPPGAEWATG